ncbi:MAG: hypothetical protein RXN78_02620 [Vulcanisaeta sp.]|jgi:hypothetical protein
MIRSLVTVIIALVVLILGLVLFSQSLAGKGEVIDCVNGKLNSVKTCVLPGYVTITNYVHGNALVSINGGSPVRLTNGSIIARDITYIPLIRYVSFSNKSQVIFNIFNPTGKWINITLPGECLLTLNVTILGSGYISITALSNNRTMVYTPYTYSLLTNTVANNDLNIYIKPAIPLSCPCINTITIVSINGTCSEISTATIEAMAYVSRTQINWVLLMISVVLMSMSTIILIINAVTVLSRRR